MWLVQDIQGRLHIIIRRDISFRILQDSEQSAVNMMHFSMAEKLYPNRGYHSVTGGYPQNLRNSTSIEKVRDYHRKYYRWIQFICN